MHNQVMDILTDLDQMILEYDQQIVKGEDLDLTIFASKIEEFATLLQAMPEEEGRRYKEDITRLHKITQIWEQNLTRLRDETRALLTQLNMNDNASKAYQRGLNGRD
jgi:hypothetical protein